MILGLWAVILGLVVYSLVPVSKRKDKEGFLWTGIVTGLIFLAICIGAPLHSGAAVARYSTFYETNNINYGIAVNETASYLSQEKFENQLIAGSIEKFQQAGYVSERIKEWRDSVNGYNLNLASYRYYSENFWIGVLLVDLPDTVKTLVIE